MEKTGKKTPKEGWPRATALMSGISKMAVFDGSMMQDSEDSGLWVDVESLEIDEMTFISAYMINVFVRPLLYPIMGIPIMIWTEITSNYQIMRWLWFPEEGLDIPKNNSPANMDFKRL